MNENEVKQIGRKAVKVERFEIMATTAYHQLGDISSDDYDIAHIHAETEDYYVGNWIFGFGFCNVVFPKDTTRPLTQKELDHYNSRDIQISNGPVIPLKVNNKED